MSMIKLLYTVPVYTYCLLQACFSCKKILLFVPLVYDQDVDPDPHGSALVWLPGSGPGFTLRKESWIRIRIHIEIKADP
jgi:hypothetical protein